MRNYSYKLLSFESRCVIRTLNFVLKNGNRIGLPWIQNGINKLAPKCLTMLGRNFRLDDMFRFFFHIMYAGMETECFGENARSGNLEGKEFFDAYKSVLSSKDKEDSLVSSSYFTDLSSIPPIQDNYNNVVHQ